METDPMIPVILSGGSGSRLWPLSRKLYPKQFLALTGEHSLFQQTLQRLSFEGMQKPVVVCNLEHRFIVNEQLAQIGLGAQAMLLEPFGRNTAPAVAMATYVSCLWQLNPELDLTRLLAPKAPTLAPASRVDAPCLDSKRAAAPKSAKSAAEPAIKTANHDEQQAQIERNFAAAKAALDFFKSPLF